MSVDMVQSIHKKHMIIMLKSIGFLYTLYNRQHQRESDGNNVSCGARIQTIFVNNHPLIDQ